jgi:hypothetical protein
MTATQLLKSLEATGTETDYAGPESLLHDYVNVSATVLEDAHPEASKPSIAGSCGCTPQSPNCLR